MGNTKRTLRDVVEARGGEYHEAQAEGIWMVRIAIGSLVGFGKSHLREDAIFEATTRMVATVQSEAQGWPAPMSAGVC